MSKDFSKWIQLKANLDAMPGTAFAHPREIWWCSLGANVGVETDGKNENFERPVIVMRVYNTQSMLVLPLTSKERNDRFHHKIATAQKESWVKLTQARVVSNKRLLRKVDVLGQKDFEELQDIWKAFV